MTTTCWGLFVTTTTIDGKQEQLVKTVALTVKARKRQMIRRSLVHKLGTRVYERQIEMEENEETKIDNQINEDA